MKVLFLSSDQIEGHIGASQIAPYCEGLSRDGLVIDVVDPTGVTRFDDGRRRALRRFRRPRARLPMRFLSLHSTALMASVTEDYSLIHARSYEAAAVARNVAALTSRPWIFDMRGFWFDEKALRIVTLNTPFLNGAVHLVEERLLRDASAIVCLTRRAADWLVTCGLPEEKVEVVPTAVDLELFHPPQSDATVEHLVYSGSLGERYDIDALLEFFAVWREEVGPESRLLVLSKDDIARLTDRPGYAKLGSWVDHDSLSRPHVAARLRTCRAGAMFYQTGHHSLGTAPTKLGEFLASGLPVVANGIGDVPSWSGSTRAVVDLRGGVRAAARALAQRSADQEVRVDARRLAESHFSVSDAISVYSSLYRRTARSASQR